jgi:BirA family biotin operon repressor/biotin-[acetyl-CoA-carboxylase] ligase
MTLYSIPPLDALLPADPPDAIRIASLRKGHASAVAIRSVASTGSTNADLLAEAQQRPEQMRPTLLIAQMQTAGRGRAGRVWHTAPGAALTFSLAWKFDCGLQRLAGLPLAVGTVLAETLVSLGQPVQLKWPNDLLLEGAKLGGVLIETTVHKQAAVQPPKPVDAATGDVIWAVIGIGLNLALPDTFRSQFNSANASALLNVEREQLLATLLNQLAAALVTFEENGFAAFMARWSACHAYAGKAVHIVDQGRVVQQGTALGVDDTGRLLLDTAAGPVAITAGDVSLRLQHAGPGAITGAIKAAGDQ